MSTALLDINSLFSPAPSGITPGNPGAAPASGSWISQILAIGQTLQLQTTSWQSGGAVRTCLAITAQLMSQEDVVVSIMAMGGFLDYAATGSVTYTALNGTVVTQQVTPDPSIPSQNPTGALGWLDVLANSVYNVQRQTAQQATGILAIANTTASTYGAFAAGTYHIANPITGAGYTNQASLTIAAQNLVGGGVTGATNTAPITITTNSAHGLTSSNIVQLAGVAGNTAANGIFAITVVDSTHFILNGSTGNGAYTSGGTVNVCTTATIVADLAGTVGTSAPNAITNPTTVLSGVTVSNPASLVGTNWESNTSVAARCRLKLQSLSPNGPSGAYKYFALSAALLLAAQTPAVTLSAPITRALVQTSASTGIVTTTVASSSGTVPGVSNLGVTAATNATPIAITTASAHGLSTGNFVTLSGVLGNTAANGTWTITVTGSSTFTLTGSSGNAAYTSGGIVEGGDLGEVDAIIQANAVPNDITAITQSATPFNVAIVGNVTVPFVQVASYTAAVQTALALYFANLPIGGIGSGILSYDDIVGILFQAGSIAGQTSYVISLSGVTVNGGTIDISYGSPTSVAVLSPTPAITVTGA